MGITKKPPLLRRFEYLVEDRRDFAGRTCKARHGGAVSKWNAALNVVSAHWNQRALPLPAAYGSPQHRVQEVRVSLSSSFRLDRGARCPLD